jgi:hypothetical protein
LCDAESDGGIRKVLRDLPRDLGETYNRLLARITGSERQAFVKRAFQWIIYTRRPLHIDELREAIAFTIDDSSWDADKIPTDIRRLIRSANNLIIVDKETKTAQLAHYTVEQYLISENLSSNIYQFHPTEAKVALGEVCVAYLSFSNFETELIAYKENHSVKAMKLLEQTVSSGGTPLINNGDKPVSSQAVKLISSLQKHRSKPITIEYGHILPQVKLSTRPLVNKYTFLNYIIENWLWHTTILDHGKEKLYRLFTRLVLEGRPPLKLWPWEPSTSKSQEYQEIVTWAFENDHPPVLYAVSGSGIRPELLQQLEDAADWFHAPILRKQRISNYHIKVADLEKLVAPRHSQESQTDIAHRRLYTQLLSYCRQGKFYDGHPYLRYLCSKKTWPLKDSYTAFLSHLRIEAAATGQTWLVRLLSTQGYIPKAVKIRCDYNGIGYTSFDRAKLSGNFETSEYLLTRGFQGAVAQPKLPPAAHRVRAADPFNPLEYSLTGEFQALNDSITYDSDTSTVGSSGSDSLKRRRRRWRRRRRGMSEDFLYRQEWLGRASLDSLEGSLSRIEEMKL